MKPKTTRRAVKAGATLINDKALIERAEIIREKGTNRSQFFRGQVDKYTWRDIGSSYLMSDLQAAYLWAQLEAADRINQQRLALWQNYYDALAPLAKAGRIEAAVDSRWLRAERAYVLH
ncbi:dTDP-4-oxo-6-deoxy-D-glucose transaminase [Escherichia coli]|uniref:dTDP-4-oxo-6-deoxy-D-glucose transaminase n=1 Tax=Escherichia coli TaxID=562 RepID=A0A485JPD6_ECOLX|nr:dTDP-4-oxo-6-deoxy-D-glucose transaminase [Escherichia coli]